MTFALNSEIGKKDIVIAIIPSANHKRKALEIAKYLSQRFKRICYVNLTQPLPSLLGEMEKNNVACAKFLFVDAITKKNPKKNQSNCIYVNSPKALTDLSITISKSLETKAFNAVLFDSFSTLLVYNSPQTVIRFAHDLFGKFRAAGILTIITADEGTDKSVLGDVSMFADVTIRVKKGGSP
jgi:archaellum biogenesis ATPase FlaH